jgi:hypothetical protein
MVDIATGNIEEDTLTAKQTRALSGKPVALFVKGPGGAPHTRSGRCFAASPKQINWEGI